MSGPQLLLVPGFNGTATQPLLVRLKTLLHERELDATIVELPHGRPSEGLKLETDALESHLKKKGRVLLAGRSFGGRVCARLALRRRVDGLVLLGFPIRPPKRPRPDDEAALRALDCPTLILQGSDDELGPLRVLEPLVNENPRLSLEVLRGAGHSFGRHEKGALVRAADWLAERAGST